MNISELTKLLEEQVNLKLEEMQSIDQQVEELMSKMASIWVNDLKPAETFVRLENPHLCKIFDRLEKIYDNPKKKESGLEIGTTISSYDQKD